MTEDPPIAKNLPLAADIDTICEAFAKALEQGEIGADRDSTFDFDLWLDRVDPQHRAQLAHHLTFLHAKHVGSQTETTDLRSTNLDFAIHRGHVAAEPRTVNESMSAHDAAYQAVFTCATLSRLPHEAKLALVSGIEQREFEPGERLLSQGEPAAGLFLLLSGRVEVVDTSGVDRHRIDFDGPGSVLGEMSLLTGQLCSADVIAMVQTVALVLPVAAFENLRTEYPELEIALSQLVSDRLGQRPHDALCGKTLGGYKLLRCISRGAMGVVYEARCEETGEPRALKMLRHRFIADARALSRFDFEVDLLSKLRHDHIVRTHGHFVAYRTRFLVLDLCDGADLKRTLINHGPMGESTVRAILGQIASGLQYAHSQGALHLDLKPANVLVDRRGHVSITDFGLGRLMQSDGCDESIAGTPSYMSPEQFRGTDVGPACDWYSMGCLAYELLTGKLLFPEQELAKMFSRKHFLAEEIWPEPNISEELRASLYAALEPMVEYRHLNLRELAMWSRPVCELAEAICR